MLRVDEIAETLVRTLESSARIWLGMNWKGLP